MTNTVVLPPGVSLELYNLFSKTTLFFDGQGQAGYWADAGNWWKGIVPTSTSFVLVPVSTTLNGSFTAGAVMLLGTETVSINGTLTSTQTNLTRCFMVCDGAVANFNPGSALAGGGAMVVGADATGTLTATGTASHGTTLSALNAQFGRMDQGNGTVTLNDATLNVSKSLVVGLEGTGTLSVTNGGVVTATEVQVGVRSGSAGDIALSNGGTLNASSSLSIGSGPTALDGSGTGTVSVGASSLITVGSIVLVHANQTLALSGGMVAMGPNAEYLNIDAGGTLSGYGTVSAQSGQGIYDHGTISAIGGTLVLNGSVHDNGVLAIGNASTAFVNGTLLGPVAVEFTGAAGTLELATGITSYAQIHDFAVGDQIVMAGVNGIGWDAALGVLELKNSGHAVDRLHFVGSYAADHFTISQSSAGAVIGLATGH